MSHFLVFVAGPHPDMQLAGYDEQRFFVFHNRTEQYRDEYAHNEELREKYPSFEKFCEEWHGATFQNGEWGVNFNPVAKWDWYVTGGRWENFLLLKDGTFANEALKKDIDFEGMREACAVDAAKRYDEVAGNLGDSWKYFIPFDDFLKAHNNNVELARNDYWEQPCVKALGQCFSPDQYMCSREDFIARARKQAATPFAFVREHKWHEKGEMGWWACVSNEKKGWHDEFEKLFSEVKDDELITVIDCHI